MLKRCFGWCFCPILHQLAMMQIQFLCTNSGSNGPMLHATNLKILTNLFIALRPMCWCVAKSPSLISSFATSQGTPLSTYICASTSLQPMCWCVAKSSLLCPFPAPARRTTVYCPYTNCPPEPEVSGSSYIPVSTTKKNTNTTSSPLFSLTSAPTSTT